MLISMLRIAPELERSGDLIEHIALRTTQRLTDGVTPGPGGCSPTWRRRRRRCGSGPPRPTATATPTGSTRCASQDDALDDLHVELTAELSLGQTSIAEAVELGLVARFYERLGDHAVNVARRIRYLTDG